MSRIPLQKRAVLRHGKMSVSKDEQRATSWRRLRQSLQPDEQLRSETGRQLDDVHGQLVICRLDELHPHPSYVRHHITVPASQLSALAELGDLAFLEPIVITRNRTILDGYGRLELARRQGRSTALCFECELTDLKALKYLIQRDRRSNGLNAFTRILLALDLESGLKEQARPNQRAGGLTKGSSNLTEAGSGRLDVRAEIAAAAGVSVGNVTKVKQLMKTAHPKLEEALNAKEISIHKAWQWRQLSAEKQLRGLEFYLSQRGVKKTISRLIRGHIAKRSPIPPNRPNLGDLLKCLPIHETGELASIAVVVIDAPGNLAFLTRGALRTLGSLEE